MSARWWLPKAGHGAIYADVGDPEHFTPVVVIDPEDRGQVEALSKALYHELLGTDSLGTDTLRAMRAALRSLIGPPKPDEPTGLGAVVEDASGHRWVRGPGDGAYAWRWVRDGLSTRFADIDVVKVLSEGVR